MRTLSQVTLLVALTSLLSIATPTAQAGETSCVPYNAHWMLCTTTYTDPATGSQMQEQYLAPYRGQVDSIDP